MSLHSSRLPISFHSSVFLWFEMYLHHRSFPFFVISLPKSSSTSHPSSETHAVTDKLFCFPPSFRRNHQPRDWAQNLNTASTASQRSTATNSPQNGIASTPPFGSSNNNNKSSTMTETPTSDMHANDRMTFLMFCCVVCFPHVPSTSFFFSS